MKGGRAKKKRKKERLLRLWRGGKGETCPSALLLSEHGTQRTRLGRKGRGGRGEEKALIPPPLSMTLP